MTQVQFPARFLWGASLSSYQHEGANYDCDWHLWEKEKRLEPCGAGCDHYNLFDQDFKSAKALNLNSLRISFEWSRINPKPGEFSQAEIEHYQAVLASLLKYDLKPLVTLHHFTNPSWFNASGGWLNSRNVDCFLKYLQTIVAATKDRIDTWLIFNEPLVYIYQGFIAGVWPPGECSLIKARKALANILAAYSAGYEEIKRIYGNNSVSVSLAKHMRVFSACSQGLKPLNSLAAFLRSYQFNRKIISYLVKHQKLDFIGLNYYCKEYVKFKGLVGRNCDHDLHQERKNYLGWLINSQSFYQILLSLKKLKLPIIITENGTAESQDIFYQEYLNSHLKVVARAILDSVDIGGYFWWSLLDNFEWDKGFKPRFGLLEVDYSDFKRTPRKFANNYAKIALANKIEIEP